MDTDVWYCPHPDCFADQGHAGPHLDVKREPLVADDVVLDASMEEDDATGFNVAPARYSAHGRETIDRIRDTLGDEGFAAYCLGCALKYEDRAGLKGSYQEDMTKASWYRQMHAHVKDNAPDPRVYRKKT